MTFEEKLNAAVEKKNSLVCVGLDSDFEKLPEEFKNSKNPQFEFNKKIISETEGLASSYKLNSAFYEARGTDGIIDLKLTFDFLNENYPDIPTVLDAKRADIGNTNNGYVQFAFDYLNADAITLHPYLGHEALQPFLEREDKGIIILCKTSNPGGGEIQDLKIHNEPLYKYIAQTVVSLWNNKNNCLFVIGATYPQELSEIRSIAPQMTFLIPGIGAQGGDLKSTMENGLRDDKKGLIIHSARGIIFSNSPKLAAKKLRDEINTFR